MFLSKDDHAWLTSAAEAAFKQAAAKIIERAKRTGTPIVVWQDGRVVEIPPDLLPCIELGQTPLDGDSPQVEPPLPTSPDD